jgi:hypothetical protein
MRKTRISKAHNHRAGTICLKIRMNPHFRVLRSLRKPIPKIVLSPMIRPETKKPNKIKKKRKSRALNIKIRKRVKNTKSFDEKSN